MDATTFLAAQVSALALALRAVIATHPEPERIRAVFDQLAAQVQAHPGFLGAQIGQANALRSMAEMLFRPPIAI
jgi:hypothetical protein